MQHRCRKSSETQNGKRHNGHNIFKELKIFESWMYDRRWALREKMKKGFSLPWIEGLLTILDTCRRSLLWLWVNTHASEGTMRICNSSWRFRTCGLTSCQQYKQTSAARVNIGKLSVECTSKENLWNRRENVNFEEHIICLSHHTSRLSLWCTISHIIQTTYALNIWDRQIKMPSSSLELTI